MSFFIINGDIYKIAEKLVYLKSATIFYHSNNFKQRNICL